MIHLILQTVNLQYRNSQGYAHSCLDLLRHKLWPHGDCKVLAPKSIENNSESCRYPCYEYVFDETYQLGKKNNLNDLMLPPA